MHMDKMNLNMAQVKQNLSTVDLLVKSIVKKKQYKDLENELDKVVN